MGCGFLPVDTEVNKYLVKCSFEGDTRPEKDRGTIKETIAAGGFTTVRYTNEFWTSRQRQAASIHEISYRACFKPQLPRFFINMLTRPGDMVYDPFSGRGTTAVEAALMGRQVIANDINPLSKILTAPRLALPEFDDIRQRLSEIPFYHNLSGETDLSMFYDPKTESELLSLRNYLIGKEEHSPDDPDCWIRMVATNRLTGHSKGFFSVYTMPPNQAISAESQKKINLKRGQKPEYRDVKKIIEHKTGQLLRNLDAEQQGNLRKASKRALFLENDAAETSAIPSESINLTVTSPPFLNVVQYSRDNWLRCWFNNIDLEKVEKNITMAATLDQWTTVINAVFRELYRITKTGGWVAFEVGEIRSGRVKLEEEVIPLGLENGFACAGVVVNRQMFTKTSNIWGIKNNHAGTNSNRIVLFKKPGS